jgi:hypothetical protein
LSRNHEFLLLQKQKNTKQINPIPRENQEFGIGFWGFLVFLGGNPPPHRSFQFSKANVLKLLFSTTPSLKVCL